MNFISTIRRVPSWICAKAQVFCAVFVKMFKWFWRRSPPLIYLVLTWPWRGFPVLVAYLYKVLMWILIGAAGALVFGLFIDYVTGGFSLPLWWEVLVKSTVQHRITIALALSLFFVLFLFAWVGHRRKEIQKHLRDAFRLYKPTKELILEDLGFREISSQESQRAETHEEERPFFGTYFSRKASEESESTNVDLTLDHEFAEEDLEQLLRGNKGFLLVGLPYSGKTITLFQVLRRMDGYVVVRPNESEPIPEEDVFALLKRKRVVVVLDDIATYAERNYDIETFTMRIKTATKGRYGVAGTCQDGGDITMVLTGHGNHVTNFCEALLKLRLYPMTKKERVALAQTAGIPLDLGEARLYPQPGNITMRDRTRAAQERFRALSELEQDTLRAMKLLDTGGVPVTTPRLLVILTAVFRRSVEQKTLEDILRKLWDEFFLLKQPSEERVRPHFGHLTYAVSYQEGPDLEDEYLDVLAQVLEKAKDVEALLQVANSRGRRGDLWGSVHTIDSVLRIEPQHAYAHFHRGYSLARLGKLEQALEANKRALDIKPSAEAFNNRSYILSLLRKFPDALTAVNSALDLRSDYDDAHTNRAIVLARLGRFSESMEEFKDALGIRPESYYAYLNLGITLSRQDSFKESLEAYNQALRVRPKYPEAYLNRGITLGRMHKFEDALDAFDHAIELRPKYAEAHLHRGETLASHGRYPEALESLKRAIEIRPDYTSAYVNRARTFGHMGPEYQEAAHKDWQTALDLGLEFPQTDLRAGLSLARSGAFQEAITILDKVVDSYPESAEAHCARGSALANLGRHEEAIEAIKVALEIRPEFATAHLALGYALTSIKGFDKARLKRALQAYDEAIRLRPNYAEAHRERGFVLGQLGFDEEALKAFDRAIELRPEFAEALFGKARSLCFLMRRDSQRFPPNKCFEEVMGLLKRAAEIDTSIISRIAKDHSAFRELRVDPNFGPYLNSLIWEGSTKNKGDLGISPAPL